MQKPDKIDFAKLLGFGTVARRVGEKLDLRNDTIGNTLGAKIGLPESNDVVDLRDDTFGAKLGAKVSVEPVDSDARVKRDIAQVATRGDGLPIYSFRYLSGDAVHVGVMAQDLLRNETWRRAVVTKDDGMFAVDYARIGLRMASLEEWQARGMDALTPRKAPSRG